MKKRYLYPKNFFGKIKGKHRKLQFCFCILIAEIFINGSFKNTKSLSKKGDFNVSFLMIFDLAWKLQSVERFF